MLSPAEIKDQTARQLQQSHIYQLRAVAGAIQAQTFPYPFFLSRVLDVNQKQMAHADQRSIRFDRYNNQTFLMITGNYYVSYAADQVNANERIHKTLDEVVLPMLQSAVSQFANIDDFDGYAFEIAYHVRQKAMGMRSENAENVVFIFPRKAAQHLTGTANDEQLQAAILESKVFLDAEPFTLWVSGDRPSDEEIQKRRNVASADHKTTVEGMSVTAGSGLPPQSSVSHESVNPADNTSTGHSPRDAVEFKVELCRQDSRFSSGNSIRKLTSCRMLRQNSFSSTMPFSWSSRSTPVWIPPHPGRVINSRH